MTSNILKLIVVFLSMAVMGCTNNIKQSQLPSIVLNAFKLNFSNATGDEWQRLNNVYEVEFEIEGIEHSALIDENGTIKMIKQEININQLPLNISNIITKNYKNYKIDEVEKIEKEKNIFYQIELNGKKNEHIIFEANGMMASLPYWD